MPLSTAVWSGLGLGLFMAISVGPTLFAVIRYSLNHSYRAGIAFVLGVSLSDGLYVTLANLATPVLKRLQEYQVWLAWSGGAALVLMGLFGLLRKYRPQRPSQRVVQASRHRYLAIFGSGFLINTVNPGVIVHWLSAATLVAGQSGLWRLVFFSACLVLVLGVDFGKVALADWIRRRLTLRRIMYLQRIAAAALAMAGCTLLWAAATGVFSGGGKGGGSLPQGLF